MKQLTKKDAHKIASLIFNSPLDILSKFEEDDICSLADYKKYFFSAEMSFFLFFWIVNNCLQNGSCDKNFVMNLENEVAKLFAKKLKGKAGDYKIIIRNRFTSYPDLKSSGPEDRAKERENLFIHYLHDDIERGGFSSFIPDSNEFRAANLLHRFLYNRCLREILENKEIAELL